MTRTRPSSLVRSLLRFVETRNEALAGDLAEEWREGRSRQWRWWQLARAVAAVTCQRRLRRPAVVPLARTAPLVLPDDSSGPIDRTAMSLRGTGVRGVGGGGLLGVVFVITIVVPQAWFLVLSGIAGGVVVGITMVLRRRDRGLGRPDGSGPMSLFESVADAAGDTLPPNVSRLAAAAR